MKHWKLGLLYLACLPVWLPIFLILLSAVLALALTRVVGERL